MHREMFVSCHMYTRRGVMTISIYVYTRCNVINSRSVWSLLHNNPCSSQGGRTGRAQTHPASVSGWWNRSCARLTLPLSQGGGTGRAQTHPASVSGWWNRLCAGSPCLCLRVVEQVVRRLTLALSQGGGIGCAQRNSKAWSLSMHSYQRL